LSGDASECAGPTESTQGQFTQSPAYVEYEGDDVEDELESDAEYEWEGMDAYDEMLAAYAYDNDVFEWSFH